MMQGKKNKILGIGVLIIALIVAVFYFQGPLAVAETSEDQKQKAMPVTVQKVALQPIQIWNEYSARLEAVDYAEIRPQVSGTIMDVKFKDGQTVEAGALLYIIDPRPYEAAVLQAEADLNSAKTQSDLTLTELKRAEELIKSNAISKRILDERFSAHEAAEASVKAAQARLDRIKIDVDYAYVKAPIAGRVSRAEIKKGNLVQAGPSAPLLTSIVSTQSIYADFEVDEQSYLKYIRGAMSGAEDEKKVPVKLVLREGFDEYEGFIDSFDNRIDVATGTIRARALFKNKDGALLPGMFANVKMGTPLKQEEIIINEKAIGTDQDRKFVYVVNDENIVDYRQVKIGKSINGQRVISSGLNDGDLVITEGIIRLRPGAKVDPQN